MAKSPMEIRSLARAHTETAVNTLAGIMNQNKAPAAARVAAAQALLDRGWGKAVQFIEKLNGSAVSLSDDELNDIAAGSGEGADPAPIDPSQLN